MNRESRIFLPGLYQVIHVSNCLSLLLGWIQSGTPSSSQHIELQLRKIRTCRYCLSNEINGFFYRVEYSNRFSACLGAGLPGPRVAECAFDGPLSDALLSSLWRRQSSESQPLMRLNWAIRSTIFWISMNSISGRGGRILISAMPKPSGML